MCISLSISFISFVSCFQMWTRKVIQLGHRREPLHHPVSPFHVFKIRHMFGLHNKLKSLLCLISLFVSTRLVQWFVLITYVSPHDVAIGRD